jgi:hypothetical protein
MPANTRGTYKNNYAKAIPGGTRHKLLIKRVYLGYGEMFKDGGARFFYNI